MITPAYSPTATERVLPSMALDFTTGVLDPRITFTRSTTATFVGSNGLIQTAAINAPRFDYDPATLAPKGLLIEEQRTNITPYSAATSANWSATGGTIANTGKLSPDGSANMLLFTEDTANSTHACFVNGIPTVIVSGTTYTASIYLAAGTRRYVNVNAGGYGSAWGVTVDTTNWTFNGYSVGGGLFQSATITAVGNGIYRVTVTGNQFAGGGIPAYVVVGGSLVTPAVRADTAYLGTGATFYAWGAQFESGSFATSYIPTVASTVTRSADASRMTGANFTSWYNATQGSLLIEASSPSPPAGTTFAGAIIDGAPLTNAVRVQRSATNVAQVVIGSGGVNSASSTSSWPVNTVRKLVAAYGSAGNGAAFNSSLLTITGNTPPVSGSLALWIGSNSGVGNTLNGHVRSIRYYPLRLTNAELQAFTK